MEQLLAPQGLEPATLSFRSHKSGAFNDCATTGSYTWNYTVYFAISDLSKGPRNSVWMIRSPYMYLDRAWSRNFVRIWWSILWLRYSKFSKLPKNASKY